MKMTRRPPMPADIDSWFPELDRFAEVPFMVDGRRQPPLPGNEDRGKWTSVTANLSESARVGGLVWQDWTAEA